jgi:hypothetical protein
VVLLHKICQFARNKLLRILPNFLQIFKASKLEPPQPEQISHVIAAIKTLSTLSLQSDKNGNTEHDLIKF